MQNPIPIRGNQVAVLGELYTVLAVTDDYMFLIGTYGKIIEVETCKDSKEPLAA